MNKIECLELFAKGRYAWNEWARDRLLELDALKSSGTWIPGTFQNIWNKETRDWHRAAEVDFSSHEFGAKADFSGFIFPGRTLFVETTFKDQANFLYATFERYVRFEKTIFQSDGNFNFVKFKGNAEITRAHFKRVARFSNTVFEGYMLFSESKFELDATFEKAHFFGGVVFTDAIFNANAGFYYTNFDNRTIFLRTIFKGDARFDLSTFGGYTEFDNAIFDSGAKFSAIDGRSAFSLANVTFAILPDFIQAHFTEAPRLDEIRVGASRSLSSAPLSEPNYRSEIWDEPARWHALRRLAIQGHDHFRELQFFKGELKSQRRNAGSWKHAGFWFGWLYQLFSDFGRSIMLPFGWWFLGVVCFAFLYFAQHPDPQRRPISEPVSSHVQTEKRSPNPANAKTSHRTSVLHSCVAATGDRRVAAALLSISKGLLFPGVGANSAIGQIYRCLYGVEPSYLGSRNRQLMRLVPMVPPSVVILGYLQNLYSAALIFLFILALRNHFRIK